MKIAIVVLLGAFVLVGCLHQPSTGEQMQDSTQLILASSAFSPGGNIPVQFTCDGADISPPLYIAGIPANGKSFALIMDDPDAPSGVFVHWIVWNISPSVNQLQEGQSVGVQGINSFGNGGYEGPCPPPGEKHTYRFKLYVLDKMLELSPDSTAQRLERAMAGHVIAKTELDGRYQSG